MNKLRLSRRYHFMLTAYGLRLTDTDKVTTVIISQAI